MNASKTLDMLITKAKVDGRMPTLENLSIMLTSMKVPHELVVVPRTGNKPKSRCGKMLTITGTAICLNSAESNYTVNTRSYAKEIIQYLMRNKIIK